MEREKLGSRLGFILLSAGCAIGVGNVWKFPWMVGQNGGAIFILFYLAFLVLMGIPVMTMEFALGRKSQKSPVKMYDGVAPQGSKWHLHGKAALAGNVILMMFYTTVTGWLLQYFVKMLTGTFNGLDGAGVTGEFVNMTMDPWMQILFVAIVVIIGFGVISLGVQKGLEKVTKWMMIALLAIMVILAINGFFFEGAGEGLAFYLVPDFDAISTPDKLFAVLRNAMSQAFFTLSLGIGSMAIFGSYIGKERSLMGESVNVAVLDTFVAFTSGLIIFPACFAFNNGAVDAGPSLIFVTLPNVFNNMPGGQIWGAFFFIFLSFAALSTIFAVFENILACIQDLTNWSRKKICVVAGVGLFVLSIPCVLGFNVLSGFNPFGSGTNIMDLEDFIVSNLLLPIGSLIFVLFCTSKKGWGWDNFVEEANTGKGLKVQKWMKGYMKYVLPVIMTAFIIISLLSFFKVI